MVPVGQPRQGRQFGRLAPGIVADTPQPAAAEGEGGRGVGANSPATQPLSGGFCQTNSGCGGRPNKKPAFAKATRLR
jgi:hypothetical protein